MRLSVITPTVGRLALKRSIASVTPQLQPGDEHLVIGDGYQPMAFQYAMMAGARYLETERTRWWGNYQRDFGIFHAQGDYLVFLDDDDVLTDHALAYVRQAIAEAPGRPLMFRMQMDGYHWKAPGSILWRQQGNLQRGEIGTPMFVCPRIPGRVACWCETPDPTGYSADHHFITRTVELYPPGSLVWREEVIAICRTPVI